MSCKIALHLSITEKLTEEYEASKGKKGKGKGSKPKGKSKGKSAPRSITPRPAQSQSSKGGRSQPKAKPEARSCMTNDFLFASHDVYQVQANMETFYMEWYRVHDLHSSVFRPGKWSLLPVSRISLYEHDAKSTHDSIQIQQTLILKMVTVSQNCVSPSLKSEIRLTPCWIAELPMFYFQDICFRKELDPSKSLSILQ